MAIFEVTISITGSVTYEVKAGSIQEAKEAILNGEGEHISTDYDEAWDSNYWEVEVFG